MKQNTYSRLLSAQTMKEVGVPYFVHVDKDTTHRQVQRMVWDRVKFTAWPAQFYKDKQDAILKSRGDVFVPASFIAWALSNRTLDRRFSIATLRNVLGLITSYSCVRLPEVYPFESAHSPTTFTEGERVEVFWENDNCCFGGKVERCVYDGDKLKQVIICYDDGDKKTYGEGVTYSMENLKERIHQARLLKAQSPYKLLIQNDDVKISKTISYRATNYGPDSSWPDAYLTSSFRYDNKPIYLDDSHHLLVHWFRSSPAKQASSLDLGPRYPVGERTAKSRLPGGRQLDEKGGGWEAIQVWIYRFHVS